MLAALVVTSGLLAETPLKQFVARPDSSFTWRASAARDGRVEIDLTSQTWQGKPWRHSISIAGLQGYRKTAILIVTGDRVDRADLPFMDRIARHSGMLTATLFDVPNQPLFDGLTEDALIAYTFGKFLETDDARWPLLFPMTNAAIRAMDALQKWDPRIERFVVTGASKRGWTTWLAAATGDRRVAGIAPMVFDFLGFEAQLRHQLESWGKYSEMLSDYVVQGQAEAATTPQGRKLSGMVDPFAYMSTFRLPKLIVLGANDRYWTADGHQLYAPKLPGPTFFRIVPNAGHDLNGGVEAAGAIAYFARGVAGRLPSSAQRDFRSGKVESRRAIDWVATSDSRDFRDCTWRTTPGSGTWRAEFREFELTPWASFTTGVRIRRNEGR